jgi:hypothetical protein
MSSQSNSSGNVAGKRAFFSPQGRSERRVTQGNTIDKIMIGVASWCKCYKNWRVFSPSSTAMSGPRSEPGYLHSVPSVEISSASSVLKESGHKSDLLDESSYIRRALESDIVH